MPFMLLLPFYRDTMKKMAAEQGWHYHPGLTSKITGTGAGGQQRVLPNSPVEKYNSEWRSPVRSHGAVAWIQTWKGTTMVTRFSKLSRFHVGVPKFQMRLDTAAIVAVILERLLTGDIQQMLVAWSKPGLRMRKFRILLKNDRSLICARIHHQANDILRVVQLGQALLKRAAA